MDIKYFSHNGEVKARKEAAVPLSNIEYQYGFGVYENIRVVNGVPFFLADHLERLIESARIISLEHTFTLQFVEKGITELVQKTGVDTYNLKILLIGAAKPEDVQLYILALNPLFPDKKLYREGASFITYEYERAFPHAKTLNMLQSYLAYRKAKEIDSYDALLIDNNGCIVEGTRTNFFCLQGKTIFSAPEAKILLGVTRKAMLKVALNNNFTLEERELSWADIQNCDGAFVTSTSSKIIPVRSIDGEELRSGSADLLELMQLFDTFLDTCKGVLA